jgi:hypothetical protein
MKCISGWYSILDSSGNCVAYVKLRIDSKIPAAAATLFHQDEVGISVIEVSASDAQLTQNATITSVATPVLFTTFSDRATTAQEFDDLDYSAPSLDDLRSKMKELDSVSAHLKKMLQRDDMNSDENDQGLIDSLLAGSVGSNVMEDSSPANAENSAPHALIAYAGLQRIFSI